MRLTFPGTRGNIPIRSRAHHRHSTVLVTERRGRIAIDCGDDWLDRFQRLRPDVILLTHAHPDHAGGLKHGADCPVYATARTWSRLPRWPIAIRREMPERVRIQVEGLSIEAWPVQHSLTAPAVGYKLFSRDACVFYVPDVASLGRSPRVLEHVDLYVGDGARLVRPLVRSRGPVLIGHASIAQQLDWCSEAGVGRAIFTHCGSGIVRADARTVDHDVRSLGRERGIEARVAFDGLTVTIQSRGSSRRMGPWLHGSIFRTTPTSGSPASDRRRPRRSGRQPSR